MPNSAPDIDALQALSVEQADREAAAVRHGWPSYQSASLFASNEDLSVVFNTANALARHRQAAYAAGAADLATTKAALADARKALDMQPIETAPRDGTEVLAWREYSGFFQAAWAVDFEGDEVVFAGWCDPVADQEVSPTHWMPLPARAQLHGGGEL